MATTPTTGRRIVTKAIAFGDTGIGTAIKVADLAAGDMVRVRAEVTTAWNSVTSDTMTIGLAKADLSSPVAMQTVNAQVAATGTAAFFAISNPAASLGGNVGRALVACAVYVKVVSAGGSLSAGAATIYAEIDTPEGQAGAAYAAPAVVDGTGTTGETVSHVA